MSGAIEKAKELVKEIKGSFMPSQFENPANAAVHFKTTGPEVWMDTDGRMDIFVAGVGSGGTITGAGEYLKSMNPDVQIVAVESRKHLRYCPERSRAAMRYRGLAPDLCQSF